MSVSAVKLMVCLGVGSSASITQASAGRHAAGRCGGGRVCPVAERDGIVRSPLVFALARGWTRWVGGWEGERRLYVFRCRAAGAATNVCMCIRALLTLSLTNAKQTQYLSLQQHAIVVLLRRVVGRVPPPGRLLLLRGPCTGRGSPSLLLLQPHRQLKVLPANVHTHKPPSQFVSYPQETRSGRRNKRAFGRTYSSWVSGVVRCGSGCKNPGGKWDPYTYTRPQSARIIEGHIHPLLDVHRRSRRGPGRE